MSDTIDKDDLFRRTKELLPKLYEICGTKCCAVLGSEFSDVMIIKSAYRYALKAADCFPIFEDEENAFFMMAFLQFLNFYSAMTTPLI